MEDTTLTGGESSDRTMPNSVARSARAGVESCVMRVKSGYPLRPPEPVGHTDLAAVPRGTKSAARQKLGRNMLDLLRELCEN